MTKRCRIKKGEIRQLGDLATDTLVWWRGSLWEVCSPYPGIPDKRLLHSKMGSRPGEWVSLFVKMQSATIVPEEDAHLHDPSSFVGKDDFRQDAVVS